MNRNQRPHTVVTNDDYIIEKIQERHLPHKWIYLNNRGVNNSSREASRSGAVAVSSEYWEDICDIFLEREIEKEIFKMK